MNRSTISRVLLIAVAITGGAWVSDATAKEVPGIDALAGKNSPLRKGDVIAFFGDSITAFGAGKWSRWQGKGYCRTITDAIAKQHPELGVRPIFAGINGDTSPGLLKRVDRDVLSKDPTVVFIYVGINDCGWAKVSKEQFQTGLRGLVKRLGDTGITVVLATLSSGGKGGEKTRDLSPDDVKEQAKVDAYADISRKVAKDTGVTLCDLRAAFKARLKEINTANKNKGVLTRDGCHLNAAGNAFVADQAARSIAESLKKRNAEAELSIKEFTGRPVKDKPRLLLRLGRYGGDEAREVVVGAVKQGSAEVRNAALRALVRWPNIESMRLALSCLDNKDVTDQAGRTAVEIEPYAAVDHHAEVKSAMRKVIKTVKTEDVKRLASLALSKGQPVSVAKSAPGLWYQYLPGRYWKVENLEKAKTGGEGVINTFDVARLCQWPRAFGARFLGYIKAPKDGAYTFYVKADNGARLWFGHYVVVDCDHVEGPPEQPGSIVLKAGLHPFRLDYYQNEGRYSLNVNVKGPGMDKQPIPDKMLWHQKRESGDKKQ
jgi:lysophospholipase L1-like esterase